MSDSLAGWLRSIAERTDAAVAAERGPLTILEELDELRLQRVERGDQRWFPRRDADLGRLAEERRARTR